MTIQTPSPDDQRSPIPASALTTAEFRELRATIRERGSLRNLAVLITFSVWAATMMWVAASVGITIFMLVPMLLLAAGFEVGFAIHVGVERIGRYIQVRYEAESRTLVAWERTSMALTLPSGGVDPLFLRLYFLALVLNLILGMWIMPAPEILGNYTAELMEPVVFVFAHAAAAVRWMSASRFARSQRVRELAAFRDVLG